MKFSRLLSALFLVPLLAVAAPERASIPAFPGAEGFGSKTPGGRGGKVLFVTNLDDSGPGSLREACEANGPRVVIFQVAGTIALKDTLTIKNPFLTLAGQSAPGDGVCLRDAPLVVSTHDVVIRFLRSRLGDVSGRQDDCIDLGRGATNVVLDHCSATWSVDECLSLVGEVSNCTVQWCLIGQSLNQSIHKKGAHGFGSLARANGPVSLHHNLWLHNNGRNPRLGDNYGKPPFPTFDVRNNVIYDYGGIASGLTQGILKVNYVGNYIRPGPSSNMGSTPIRVGGPSEMQFHIRDNIFEASDEFTARNELFFDPVEIEGKKQLEAVAEPFPADHVTTFPAEKSCALVLANVGATLPRRDSVDARLIEEVRTRTGAIINSQAEAGGWPEYKSAALPSDADRDGMPDEWETRHGLDPREAKDAVADRDKDGYTNLEEFLNGTDPKKYVDYQDNKPHADPLLAAAPLEFSPDAAPAPKLKRALTAGLHEKIEYGSAGDEKLLLDAFVPKGEGRFPVAIYVHGGGWMNGDSKEIAQISPAIEAANFAWFSINYRLAPAHRWPACFEDVQTAIRWVKAHAKEYKGDPKKIVLIGYSAGGHLAVHAAVTAEKDTRVQAVVGFAPPTDMVADNERRGGLSPSMQALLDRPQPLDDAARAALDQISPVNFLKAGLPPFLLLHGTEDKSVPYAQSVNLQAKLRALGVPCELVTLKGAPHRWTEWEKSDPAFLQGMTAWLTKTFAPEIPEGDAHKDE